MDKRPIIGKHGGFRNLYCFKLAEVVYDATIVFCGRFIDPKSRTTDQMIQAARSGRQNIAEASVDSGTSKKSELYLTNVARGSLVELQLDYEDFLRQRGLPLWDKGDPRCLKIRAVAMEEKPDRLDESDGPSRSSSSQPSQPTAERSSRRYRKDIAYPLYAVYFQRTSAEVAANAAICLCHQSTYLLNRLLLRLERNFVEQGGFTERLHAARTRRDKKQ